MGPVLVYDADCPFCRRWVARWLRRVQGPVRAVPLQDRAALLWHGVPRRKARRAVQLVEPGGRRSQGAEAVFRLLLGSPRLRTAARVGLLPGIRHAAEIAYRVIARRRGLAARLDRWLFGRSVAPPARRRVASLVVRGIGASYLIAFASLRRQVLGLYGARGVVPLADRAELLRRAPTLLRFGASDRALLRLCTAGQLCGAALLLGIAPRPAALGAWASYLSFVSVGAPFLSYQWDTLLLEAGLAAALVPARGEPSWARLLPLRLLAFRLHFGSGLAKLQSGDRAWRRCFACAHHQETQPLPTPLGWWAHQLPRPVHRAATALVLALELAVPPLAFAPRRPRRLAAALLLGLQGLIALTGNYAFFNLLAVVLTLSLLDDEALDAPAAAARPGRRRPRWPGDLAALALAGLGLLELGLRFARKRRGGRLGHVLLRAMRLHAVSSYGLFAVMTRRRPEIVIEGSDDGVTWRAYELPHKPGDPRRPPRFVAPLQPRLDWQLWFAAMQGPPAWFYRLLARLLEGSPEVGRLFAVNPFPGRPPRWVRARLYEYRMTDPRTRRQTGAFWRRTLVGEYVPPCRLPE